MSISDQKMNSDSPTHVLPEFSCPAEEGSEEGITEPEITATYYAKSDPYLNLSEEDKNALQTAFVSHAKAIAVELQAIKELFPRLGKIQGEIFEKSEGKFEMDFYECRSRKVQFSSDEDYEPKKVGRPSKYSERIDKALDEALVLGHTSTLVGMKLSAEGINISTFKSRYQVWKSRTLETLATSNVTAETIGKILTNGIIPYTLGNNMSNSEQNEIRGFVACRNAMRDGYDVAQAVTYIRGRLGGVRPDVAERVLVSWEELSGEIFERVDSYVWGIK